MVDASLLAAWSRGSLKVVETCQFVVGFLGFRGVEVKIRTCQLWYILLICCLSKTRCRAAINAFNFCVVVYVRDSWRAVT